LGEIAMKVHRPSVRASGQEKTTSRDTTGLAGLYVAISNVIRT
jgi:hypothetical protein